MEKFEKPDRRRLYYAAIYNSSPELFRRVIMLVDRVKEWATNESNNTKWARRQMNLANFIIVFVGFGYVIFFRNSDRHKNTEANLSEKLLNLSPTPLLIVLIVVAVLQSLALHSKYAAFLQARSEYRALITEIETGIHQFAIRLSNTKNREETIEILAEVDSKVSEWAQKAGKTHQDTAMEIGQSASTFTLPPLFNSGAKE